MNIFSRDRSNSSESNITSQTDATNPLPREVSRNARTLNKNASKLDKTIGKMNPWHLPFFNYKGATRKQAGKTQDSIQSLDNKSIEQLVVKKRTSGILQSFQKVVDTYNRLYPEGKKGAKTEQAVAQVLVESSRIEAVAQSVRDLITLYDDPNIETLFKALVLHDVEKPDLSSISPRTRAERIVKWLVLNQDELALLESLDVPPNLVLDKLSVEFFSFLPNLRALNLPDNRVALLPDNLRTKCPLLETIDVSGNFLTTVPPTLVAMVDLSMQTQRICDHNIIAIFNCLDLEASDKPRFGTEQAGNSIILEDWLVENKSLLKSVKTLQIPLGSSVDNLPIRILRYFSNLTEIDCPGGKITHLPVDLREYCPKLNKINVEKNYLQDVPPSLSDLVDLNSQRQRIPLVNDYTTKVFFESIPLSGKPSEGAPIEEKELWLLTNLQELKDISHIEIPTDSHTTTFPDGILQYLPGLTSISCLFGKLVSLPESLITFCPKLELLELHGNSLTQDSIPASLNTLVNLSIQKQRLPMVYDSNTNLLLNLLCGSVAFESDEEKTARLHENRKNLARVETLIVPSYSSLSDFPPCILQYLPNVQSITCLFGDLKVLSKDLLQFCKRLETLNVTGNWVSAIPVEYSRFEGLKDQKQKTTLEFRDCIQEVAAFEIMNLITRLSSCAIAFEDGLTTKKPKEAKGKIKSEVTALLENPTFKSLSDKTILYRISEDSQSFKTIVDAISNITVKKNQLTGGELFKGSNTTLPIVNGFISTLKTLYVKISSLQRSFEIFSNPDTFKDIEALVDHLLATPDRLIFRGKGQSQKENAVIMTSFLEEHRRSLSGHQILDVSELTLSSCPEAFIKEYLNQIHAIQCTEAQRPMFESFAAANGIALPRIEEPDSDEGITF